MSLAHESNRCPYCREPIAVGAIRCKHCHADLAGPRKKWGLSLPEINNFRVGFLCGLLFVAIVEVLLYYQFFAGD